MLVRLGPQPTCGPGTRELPRRECSDRDEGVDIGRTFVQLALGLAALGLACSSASSAAATAAPRGLPPSWLRVRSGPAGGAVWIGHIPNAVVPEDQRLSAVYLPPGYTATRRYPVVYLLHGLPGSASSFYDSLPIARVADTLISAGQAQPFIAVMPTGGPLTDQGDGEWAGVWERWLTEQVIPWVDSHLATQPSAAGRALAGLCAGGFGAIDIGLRHPALFSTLESWEGYFAPVFRDGPFRDASAAYVAAHTPRLLVRERAATLSAGGVRFFISVGGNHGHILRRWSEAFAAELSSLHLKHELWLLPRSERGHFGRATFAPGLAFAAAGFPAV